MGRSLQDRGSRPDSSVGSGAARAHVRLEGLRRRLLSLLALPPFAVLLLSLSLAAVVAALLCFAAPPHVFVSCSLVHYSSIELFYHFSKVF